MEANVKYSLGKTKEIGIDNWTSADIGDAPKPLYPLVVRTPINYSGMVYMLRNRCHI